MCYLCDAIAPVCASCAVKDFDWYCDSLPSWTFLDVSILAQELDPNSTNVHSFGHEEPGKAAERRPAPNPRDISKPGASKPTTSNVDRVVRWSAVIL
jgi:hypothetical protein